MTRVLPPPDPLGTDAPASTDHLTPGWKRILMQHPAATADHGDWISSLAGHAVAVGAQIAWVTGFAWEAGARAHLFQAADTALAHGAPVQDVLGWLAVLAAETDAERYDSLCGGLTRWPTQDLAAWSATVGPLAPLAWAAGLSLTEAQARRAVGTLDEQVLRALAALRGYRLPRPA